MMRERTVPGAHGYLVRLLLEDAEPIDDDVRSIG